MIDSSAHCTIAPKSQHQKPEQAWREDCDARSCRYYDAGMLQRHMDDLEHLLEEGDTFSLIFRLRGGLQRVNFGLLQEGSVSYSVTQLLTHSVTQLLKSLI